MTSQRCFVACACLNIQFTFCENQNVNQDTFAVAEKKKNANVAFFQKELLPGEGNWLDLISPIPLLSNNTSLMNDDLSSADCLCFAALPDFVRVHSPYYLSSWMLIECFLCHTEVLLIRIPEGTDLIAITQFYVNITDCLRGEALIQQLKEDNIILFSPVELTHHDNDSRVVAKANGFYPCQLVYQLDQGDKSNQRGSLVLVNPGHLHTLHPYGNKMRKCHHHNDLIASINVDDVNVQTVLQKTYDFLSDIMNEQLEVDKWYLLLANKYMHLLADMQMLPEEYNIQKLMKIRTAPPKLSAGKSSMEAAEDPFSEDIPIEEDIFNFLESKASKSVTIEDYTRDDSLSTESSTSTVDNEGEEEDFEDYVDNNACGGDDVDDDDLGEPITLTGKQNFPKGGIAASAPISVPHSNRFPSSKVNTAASRPKEYFPVEQQTLYSMTREERLYAIERASYLARSVGGPEMGLFGPEGPPELRTLRQKAENSRMEQMERKHNRGNTFNTVTEESENGHSAMLFRNSVL